MNDAAYAQVLTDANELFLDALGLSAAYRERTGGAMYTVEITLKFLHEVNATDTITAESRVASYDAKRLRVHSTLLVGEIPVASGDSLYLHVDTATGKVSPFPDDRVEVLARALADHGGHDEAPASS
jgi:acyl-CoA thioesterase FadM